MMRIECDVRFEDDEMFEEENEMEFEDLEEDMAVYGETCAPKEVYITIVGMNHYYGMRPFAVGKKIRCVKDPKNHYDSEAIKMVMREIGTVGYVANSPNTKVVGTMSAGRIYEKVENVFTAEVMFMTYSRVICRVVDGWKANRVGSEE